MDNFKIIYKILKHLERSLDDETTDMSLVSHEALGITYVRRKNLLIMMQQAGYIDNLVLKGSLADERMHIVKPPLPHITLQGLEYLSENNMMHKAASLVKGVAEWI